ncbi:MAG: PAS domain S-box protein, partial [Desulfobacteraceae bacterium]
MKASIKGWGYSLNHPDEVIGLMVWKCGVEKPRAHPGLIDPVFSMDGFIDNPEPEPGPDYTLLKQGVVLLVAVLLLLTGGALVLFIYNRKLAAEIEERKQAQEALLKSEKRFREILEDISNIAVQGYDEQRKVTFWNQASEQLYGYEKQEALGRKIEDLIVPFDMQEKMKRLHKMWLEDRGKIPAAELVLKDKNGEDVPVFSSHTMHETLNGKEMFCVDVDLRPVKQAEKEKIQAQKTAAEQEKYSLVGKIAGTMAHDFNNILGVIMGNTELAIIDCPHEPTSETLHL